MAQKWGGPQNLTLKDFSGGQNSKDSPILLAPNEMEECQNLIGNLAGVAERRRGITKYNTTTLTEEARGVARFYREGNDPIVIVAGRSFGGLSENAHLWLLPTSGAATDLGLDHDGNEGYTISGAQILPMFAQYRGRMYGVATDGTTPINAFVIADHPDGSGDPLAWEMGVAAPSAALTGTVVNKGAGSLEAGTYKYKYTYGYGEDGAHGESNPVSTELSIAIAGGDAPADIQLDVTRDHADWDEYHDAGIDKLTIYRTIVDGSDYYWIADVTSGTTYTDTTASGSEDDSTIPPSDNYTPDTALYLCVHGERMFMANLKDSAGDRFRKRVRWSAAGYPDIWPADNYADAPAEHGDCMGMLVLNGTLYVFFESAIGRITVHSGADATFEIVTAEVGVYMPRTLVAGRESGGDVAFFVAPDKKAYAFDGYRSYWISRKVQDVLDASSLNWTVGTTAGGWDGRAYHLSVTATQTSGATELRYDTLLRNPDSAQTTGRTIGTWWPCNYGQTTTDKDWTGYCHFTGGGDDGLLVRGWYDNTAATGNRSYVYKLDIGDDDDGSDIGYYLVTGELDLGASHYEKRLNQIALEAESPGGAITMTTHYYYNWSGTAHGSFASQVLGVPNRYYGGRAGRTSFKNIQIKVSGSDSEEPSAIYAVHLRYEVEREDRGTS